MKFTGAAIALFLFLSVGFLATGCKDNKVPPEAGPSGASAKKAASNAAKPPPPKRLEWYCADETSGMPCVLDPDLCAAANSDTPCMPTSPVHCYSYEHQEKGHSMSCHAKADHCAAARGKREAAKDPKVRELSACGARD